MKFLKLIGINVICFIALLGSFELLSKLLTIAYLSKVTRDQDWNIELNIAAGITHKKSDFDKSLNSKDSISKRLYQTSKAFLFPARKSFADCFLIVTINEGLVISRQN